MLAPLFPFIYFYDIDEKIDLRKILFKLVSHQSERGNLKYGILLENLNFEIGNQIFKVMHPRPHVKKLFP